MAERPPQTRQKAAGRSARPELDTEFASRLRDPFEPLFNGLIQPNDPLLLERGGGDVQIYRDLKRDGKVFDGLQKRRLALIGKAWQVEPREDNERGTKDAETVTGILKAASFDRVCSDLLEALLTGMEVAEVVWTVRDNMIVPARVVKRARRRFRYVQVEENKPPELRLLTRANMLTGEPVPERKFIAHRVNPEDDNPHGTGLGLQLYWPVFFKRKGIVAWNKLCDRFGSPTPHGKYPRGASPKEKSTLSAALRAMSSDGYLMTPEGMEIALLESKLAGNVTTQQALCEYMDDWIGAVLTGREARGGSGGAQEAASKERQDVREDLTQADSDLLSETLNSTLLAWICDYNGLTPCMVYRQIKKDEDRKAMAEADKIVSDMGFELDLDQVRTKYGEGWNKKAAPPPAPALPGVQLPGQPAGGAGGAGAAGAAAEGAAGGANFAEAAPAAGVTSTLARASALIVDGWISTIRGLVLQFEGEQLQDAIVQAFGNLPSEQIGELMALAFALADLQGRDQVQQEQADA